MNISPIEEVKRNICGYKVQQFQGPVKRYCQTMDLKDDPELIKSTFNVIVKIKHGRR